MEWQVGQIFIKAELNEDREGLKKLVAVVPVMFGIIVAIKMEWVKWTEPPDVETLTYPQTEQVLVKKVQGWLL